MTTPAGFNTTSVVLLLLGVILITVGMAFGLGMIGTALVRNNPEAGNLYNPQDVSTVAAGAGAIIGVFVSLGSAFLALAIHKWK